MQTAIFMIMKTFPGKLSIMTRPNGNEWIVEDIMEVKRVNTDILVSLLDDQEIEEMGLGEEAKTAKDFGIEFIHFPITDHSTPIDFEKASRLVEYLSGKLLEDKNITIHCRKAIGRSPMLAAAIMVYMGEKTRTSFSLIKKARKKDVPENESQFKWVKQFESLRPEDQKTQMPNPLNKLKNWAKNQLGR